MNFNLHGPMEASSISVVEVDTMSEVARVDTGVRPHGGRLSRDGSAFYSVNMMDFELVELDAFTFEITRRLPLGEGVMPTWVTRPTVHGKVYVTGNNVARIFEIDLEDWRVERTLEDRGRPLQHRRQPRRHAHGRHLQERRRGGVLGPRGREGGRPDAHQPHHFPTGWW